MRRILRILVACLVLGGGVLAGGSPPACACSCPEFSTRQKVERADLVARARVVEVTEPAAVDSGATRTYRLELERLYQGSSPVATQVTSSAQGASCGLEGISPGDDIVLFATGSEGDWKASLCGGTTRADARASGGDVTVLAEVEQLLGSGSTPSPTVAAAPAPAGIRGPVGLPLVGVSLLIGLGLALAVFRRR
ncbi:hypothetical protein [Luteococcus peritonei]|uniref:Tissue inhibitor of metalloproteinase n=1 Tax=Luteococcus peritonei TaxID=88874 RepID=A0ABW4RUW2_9ACTN